jgi:hypothetical protein
MHEEANFLVEKQSKWRGKYSRIIQISGGTIATIDPSSYEKTNEWPLSEIVKVRSCCRDTILLTEHDPPFSRSQVAAEPSSGKDEAFGIQFRNRRELKFTCKYRYAAALSWGNTRSSPLNRHLLPPGTIY